MATGGMMSAGFGAVDSVAALGGVSELLEAGAAADAGVAAGSAGVVPGAAGAVSGPPGVAAAIDAGVGGGAPG
jgi:hypothetical protein